MEGRLGSGGLRFGWWVARVRARGVSRSCGTALRSAAGVTQSRARAEPVEGVVVVVVELEVEGEGEKGQGR